MEAITSAYVKIRNMLTIKRPIFQTVRRQWWLSLPFAISVVVLLGILWTIVQVIAYPHDGIETLHPDGSIGAIESGGPADNLLFKGDVIKEIDGQPWGTRITTYYDKHPGDLVGFVIDRGGREMHISIRLVQPDAVEIFFRLIPILVALIFWSIGLGVQTFRPPDSAASIFFYWCQVSAVSLTAGVASYLGPRWASSLFNALVWFIGPLSIHLHFHFPQKTASKKQNWIVAFFYALALIGAAPHLISIFSGVNLRVMPWFPQLVTIGRFYLAINLLVVGVLLVYAYMRPKSPGVRSRIRLVALGGGLTVLLIVTLTILPDALFQNTILPYRFAFALLSFIPISYGYAIFRLHLIEIERHVNRGATYILVYSIMGAAYLILFFLLHRFLPEEIGENRILDTLLVLFLATVFIPLHSRVQKFVDTMFYGGWYDYRLGVMNITHGLELVNDYHELAQIVGQRLVNILRLEEACVFFRDADGEFSIVEVASRYNLDEQPPRHYPHLPRSSLEFLLNLGVVEKNNLRKALEEVALSAEELQLLKSEQIHLWVPVIAHAKIQGLLALGPKLGGDIFSSEDIDIMRVVARQIAPILENLHLVTRLRQYAAELEHRVKLRTAELFNAKERVEAILASVGEGVVVTDLNGQIEIINSAFERQSGFTFNDLVGQDFFSILNEYNEAQKVEEVKACLKQGEVWSGELLSRRKNGRLYDILLTIAPVRDQSGHIVSYVGSQRDITHQKELDRMKDIFVADVSHELRTPTTNINLYLDLLESSPPEKHAQYLAVIREQSFQLTKLVEDILDLSRITKARVSQLEFAPVDLNKLVLDVITAHAPMAEAAGVEVTFTPGATPLEIQGEYNQLSRMLANLITNAIRYSPEGKVQLETGSADKMACLSIRDTGMGIPEEDLPHIFDRFYRGKNVRQSSIHGTGLGLAIVREIVDLHRGKIDVQSEIGKGSVFQIWLPI